MVESSTSQSSISTFQLDESSSFCRAKLCIPSNFVQGAKPNDDDGWKNRIFIQCLDKSGSMSGSPMDSIKQGASMVLEQILSADKPSFDQVYTISFN